MDICGSFSYMWSLRYGSPLDRHLPSRNSHPVQDQVCNDRSPEGIRHGRTLGGFSSRSLSSASEESYVAHKSAIRWIVESFARRADISMAILWMKTSQIWMHLTIFVRNFCFHGKMEMWRMLKYDGRVRQNRRMSHFHGAGRIYKDRGPAFRYSMTLFNVTSWIRTPFLTIDSPSR